jgi:hypothetical protein
MTTAERIGLGATETAGSINSLDMTGGGAAGVWIADMETVQASDMTANATNNRYFITPSQTR